VFDVGICVSLWTSWNAATAITDWEIVYRVAIHLENLVKSESLRVVTGQGKVTRNKGKFKENVFSHVVSYHEYCSWHKICKKGVHNWAKFCIWNIPVVVIVLREYMSIAVIHNMHRFVLLLLQGSILRKHSLEMSVKVREYDRETGEYIVNIVCDLCRTVWNVSWMGPLVIGNRRPAARYNNAVQGF